jgi:hypothetical protein
MDTGPDFRLDDVADGDEDHRHHRERGEVFAASDLTRRRWRHAALSPSEVADLLRAAKGPDPALAAAAKTRLVQSYHRLLLKEAKNHRADFPDLMAAGALGFTEAIDRFDLNRNNGFTAFALPYVRGRMKAAAKAERHQGWSGETRLERAIEGNHDLTLGRAAEIMGRVVTEAELDRARDVVLAKCTPLDSYNTREPTREPGFEDDDEEGEGKRAIVGVAPMCAVHWLDAAKAKAHGIRHFCLVRGVRVSLLDGLAEDADRRAERRIKEIGRRAAALELVERDRVRIAARAEPSQYLYRTNTPVESREHIAFRMGTPAPRIHPATRSPADRSWGCARKKRKKRRQKLLRARRRNESAQQEKDHNGRLAIVLAEAAPINACGDDGRGKIRLLLGIRCGQAGLDPAVVGTRPDAGPHDCAAGC